MITGAQLLLMKELYQLTKTEPLPPPITYLNREYSYMNGNIIGADHEMTERDVAEHVLDFQMAMDHQAYQEAREEYLWLKKLYGWE